MPSSNRPLDAWSSDTASLANNGGMTHRIAQHKMSELKSARSCSKPRRGDQRVVDGLSWSETGLEVVHDRQAAETGAFGDKRALEKLVVRQSHLWQVQVEFHDHTIC